MPEHGGRYVDTHAHVERIGRLLDVVHERAVGRDVEHTEIDVDAAPERPDRGSRVHALVVGEDVAIAEGREEIAIQHQEILVQGIHDRP